MRGFVFMFDVLLGLLSLLYILSFVFAVPSNTQELLLDFSSFRKVSDFLIVTNSMEDQGMADSQILLGRVVCSPPQNCDNTREWVCGKWNRSVLKENKVVFEPMVLCLEGFA